MEEVIASQRKDRKPEEVEELYLDNVRSSSISGLSSEYNKLKKLSVVNNGLTSLDGLPELPLLERLHASDNKLTGGLEHVSKQCPNIKILTLAGNKIAKLEDLKPLSELEHLSSVDLFNCPVTTIEDYRNQVFEMIPSLNSLDGLNKNGEEVDDESEGEEEEEEEGGGGSDEESDDEPGLDYLNRNLESDSSGDEEDYDPDQDEDAGEDDAEFDPSEEDDGGAGPSSSKRLKLDPSAVEEAPKDSDSD